MFVFKLASRLLIRRGPLFFLKPPLLFFSTTPIFQRPPTPTSKIDSIDSALAKILEILEQETSPEKLRRYLVHCVSQGLENRSLFHTLLQKVNSKISPINEKIPEISSFWTAAFKVFKAFESDPDIMALFKEIYRKDIDVLIKEPKAFQNLPIHILAIIKPASFLCEDRLGLLEFEAKYLLMNFKACVLRELIYFMKDFVFLYQKGLYFEVLRYNPESPETVRMAARIQVEIGDLSMKDYTIDKETLRKHREAYNQAFQSVQKNRDFWKHFELKLKGLESKFDEKMFNEALATLKRNEVSRESFPNMYLLLKGLFKRNIRMFNEDNMRNILHHQGAIGMLDAESLEITKNWVLMKIQHDAMEIVNFTNILRSFSSKYTGSFKGISPYDPFFDNAKAFLLRNLQKINAEAAVSILSSYSFFNKKDPELFAQLLTRIKSNGKLMISDHLLGLLMRTLCVFELYEDRELWSLIEDQLYAPTVQSFLQNPEKETFVNVKMAQTAVGLLALSLERPEYIKNPTMFKDVYERFKKIYRKSNQLLLIERFNESEMGTFSVYHLLKAMELNPIPEQIIEIFNIDLHIPEISLEKLESIRKLDLDNVVARAVDPQNIAESHQNLDKLKNIEFWLEKNEQYTREFEKKAAKNEEMVKKKGSLLIEIHGPDHYNLDERFVRGGTALKERLLRKMGYKLMVIPHSECIAFQRKVSRREIIIDLIERLKKEI